MIEMPLSKLIMTNFFSLVVNNAADHVEPVPVQALPHVHQSVSGLYYEVNT